MMLMEQIQRGKVAAPRRMMLYGTPGIGKSTFAAHSERPIFLQTEDGLGQIECDKFPVAQSLDDVIKALSELYTADHPYRTVVVDTLDWLERLIWAEVCRRKMVESIEDIGYQKGYTFALNHWRDVLMGLDALRRDRDMTVVLVAHCKIEKFDDPANESYDRYTAGADRVPRILFLADRNVLRDQAYNTFEPFENERDVIAEGKAPINRSVYFSIYQAMFAGADGKRLYQQYPKDFFDLIVIDECHRSGFGTWNAILKHFDSAVQLGMTATPKRTENIDTYKYFGDAVFTYSLGQGIDDGFLATYKVHRSVTNFTRDGLDIHDVTSKGAQLEVPEGGDVDDRYDMPEFERKITMPDHIKKLCEHMNKLLHRFGRMEKTMVFYAAGTWDRARRVIVKAEHSDQGANPRFVVTNLPGDPQELYDEVYCQRGEMENRIKEQQLHLFADRTSCHAFAANQFRLLLSAAAYLLLETLRRVGLRGTSLARAQCDTIRLKLLKIGARVVVSVRRVVLHLASGYPLAGLLRRVLTRLAHLRPVPL